MLLDNRHQPRSESRSRKEKQAGCSEVEITTPTNCARTRHLPALTDMAWGKRTRWKHHRLILALRCNLSSVRMLFWPCVSVRCVPMFVCFLPQHHKLHHRLTSRPPLIACHAERPYRYVVRPPTREDEPSLVYGWCVWCVARGRRGH